MENRSLPQIDLGAERVALARSYLGAFVMATQPGYLMGWVHECICDELEMFLQAVAERKSPRLMITVPPRHGKSTIASRCFPAYALGRYPDMQMIGTSYSAELASAMNRDVQRIIDSDEYRRIFPETTIAGVHAVKAGSWARNADYFEVVGRHGCYRSAGVGGGLTGFGTSCAIIDDPVKNRAEADSLTVRNAVWNWYTSTLYTRLAPGGGVIVILTKWHEDDLAGRLLEAQAKGEGDEGRVINFPAIAEQDEEHRKKGEALHPERYPLEALERIKAAIGTRDWEALYQQHPVPDGGAIFLDEWLQRPWLPKDLPPRFDAGIMSWDLSF